MIDDVVLGAIKASLDADPRNGALWARYAGMLVAAQRNQEALNAFRMAADMNALRASDYCQFVSLLRESGQLAEALIRAEKGLEIFNDPSLQIELDKVIAARGGVPADPVQTSSIDTNQATDAEDKDSIDDEEPVRAAIAPDEVEAMLEEVEQAPRTTFGDVVGLEEVKKQIYLRIIAPFKKQDIFKAFSRKAGGGILLYGPPGCGKTMIARATAGECKARFVSVSIHDIIDQYWGQTEKFIHRLFVDARRLSPTVLFFDEFDALGASRGRTESPFWKSLVDQLLHEMDGIDQSTSDLLIFAATNMPWGIDPAFRRPGRFDRLFFIPPPDEEGRTEMLRRHLKDLPGGGSVKPELISKRTPILTGADIKGLCERASERALLRSLESDHVHPITPADFDEALKGYSSSAAEWLQTAKNYARYSNDGGQYDDLANYLRKMKLM
jgi:SpoVK/Ycf46/Vps4 family AAA+-type ATPase